MHLDAPASRELTGDIKGMANVQSRENPGASLSKPGDAQYRHQLWSSAVADITESGLSLQRQAELMRRIPSHCTLGQVASHLQFPADPNSTHCHFVCVFSGCFNP